MRPTELITTALLLSTPCFAWPPRLEDTLEMVERAVAPLVQRQTTASTSFDLNYTGIQGNTATTITGTTATGSGSQATMTGASNGTATGNNNSTTTSAPEFDPRLPPGGVNLITPNTALAVPTYYKIKDWVTFAWNYTSLSVTPSAVDILASCAKNQQTYTIALNQTVPSSGAQTILWDTGEFQQTATVPLLTETYTLIIHDAQQAVTALPSAGYLGVFNQYYFGMYVPQPSVAYDQYVCATCSGAMSIAERQTLTVILGVAGITVASFTWFAGVAGLW